MALAYQACRDGHRVGYYDTPKLLRELQNAQADGSLLSGEWATHPQTKKPPDLTSEGLKQLRLNR